MPLRAAKGRRSQAHWRTLHSPQFQLMYPRKACEFNCVVSICNEFRAICITPTLSNAFLKYSFTAQLSLSHPPAARLNTSLWSTIIPYQLLCVVHLPIFRAKSLAHFHIRSYWLCSSIFSYDSSRERLKGIPWVGKWKHNWEPWNERFSQGKVKTGALVRWAWWINGMFSSLATVYLQLNSSYPFSMPPRDLRR